MQCTSFEILAGGAACSGHSGRAEAKAKNLFRHLFAALKFDQVVGLGAA